MESTLIIRAPESVLIDEKITVTVEGLVPYQDITLAAYLKNEDRVFISYGHFKGTAEGRVDLSRHASLGGTYTGLDQMGLFWSMVAYLRQNRRLLKKDVTTPLVTHLVVLEGHVTSLEYRDISDWKPLVTKVISRWYKSQFVQRQEIKDGNIQGTFFLPKGPGPFPGVLDMFGAVGGKILIEHRAALLASRGFACLALKYHPESGERRTNLEYFVDAVNWLDQQPNVSKHGIGILGVSEGALMGTHICLVTNKVKAVVSINGFSHRTYELTYKGRSFPEHLFLDGEYVFDDKLLVVNNLSEGYDEEGVTSIEESEAQFLIIQSGDDQNMHIHDSEQLIRRLASHGKTNFIHKIYYGAGHLLEPPYSPHCRESVFPAFNAVALWGGTTELHAKAQEDSWRLIQAFFWTILMPHSFEQRRLYYPESRL